MRAGKCIKEQPRDYQMCDSASLEYFHGLHSRAGIQTQATILVEDKESSGRTQVNDCAQCVYVGTKVRNEA